jgi:hypothetical protein
MNSRGKIWFKAKRYGYGWYPGSWEGWLVLLVYIIGSVAIFYQANPLLYSVRDVLIGIFVPEVALTLLLIIICYLKGEPARWRWGK